MVITSMLETRDGDSRVGHSLMRQNSFGPPPKYHVTAEPVRGGLRAAPFVLCVGLRLDLLC